MQRKRTWNRKIRPILIVEDHAVILLSNGLEALIDCDAVPRVSDYNWTATSSLRGKAYATRGANGVTIYLQNEILPPPVGFVVDHIDGNPLNCRLSNLRIATPRQNTWNRRLGRANTSGFKGVFWRADRSKWLAQIAGKKLGVFHTKEEAARAYDVAATEMWGEFAVLNFPPGDEIAA